jgi:uncharacterized protein YlzI (FlbEa/FlbD family)
VKLAVAAALLVSAALSSTNARAAASVTLLRDRVVEATFQTDEGCVRTIVSVLASTQATKILPRARRDTFETAFINITRLDICPDPENPTLIESLTADPSPDEFSLTFGPALGSARLRGTAPFLDEEGTPTVLSFDIVWAASGRGRPERSGSKLLEDGTLIISRGVRVDRPAVAWGTISNGTNYIPRETTNAVISQVRTGEVTITRR